MYDQHSHRKDEHVFLAEKFYQAQPDNGLAEVRLIPNNLPEISVAKVNLTSTLAGKKIAVPFFINAMSGGSPETAKLNQKLAVAAAATNIPMATGSQSIALKFPQAAASFKVVRQNLPNGLVIGNIGASHNLADARAAVEMLQADVLEVHLNAAQEIVMAEGDRQFYWEENLQQIISGLSVPVIVKEVGFGISPTTLERLQKIGVKNVDLSGHGGTNFAKIENQRRRAKDFSLLNNFGLTTAETLLASQHFASSFSFTASGGIRDALDIVKCLVLGADNVGIAGLFLHTLIKEDVAGLINLIEDLKKQLKSIFALLGCANPTELQQVPYLLSTDLNNFKQQIKFK
ncbi:MAG: type 2 isopentenyl-diphosphate Delta-isomerase [Liquorilactobacillus nagelii]|uniref:type 2 isopentenyl-diphosphate Delta-isomerase n=1 Tax=Liquorilactobacillus nagelii TaxID=82688 RepID=UPI0039E9ADE0